jgi:hypothetical protein
LASENSKLYLVFASIHYVLAAEERLQNAGIDCDLRPIPRQISSDCGMCLVSDQTNLKSITKQLSSDPAIEAKIYTGRKDGGFTPLEPPPADRVLQYGCE